MCNVEGEVKSLSVSCVTAAPEYKQDEKFNISTHEVQLLQVMQQRLLLFGRLMSSASVFGSKFQCWDEEQRKKRRERSCSRKY